MRVKAYCVKVTFFFFSLERRHGYSEQCFLCTVKTLDITDQKQIEIGEQRYVSKCDSSVSMTNTAQFTSIHQGIAFTHSSTAC